MPSPWRRPPGPGWSTQRPTAPRLARTPALRAGGSGAWLAEACRRQGAVVCPPFAVRDVSDRPDGRATRDQDPALAVPGLAVGYTRYAAAAQRTYGKATTRRLLLGHAFDRVGCASVEFHTDFHNQQSRASPSPPRRRPGRHPARPPATRRRPTGHRLLEHPAERVARCPPIPGCAQRTAARPAPGCALSPGPGPGGSRSPAGPGSASHGRWPPAGPQVASTVRWTNRRPPPAISDQPRGRSWGSGAAVDRGHGVARWRSPLRALPRRGTRGGVSGDEGADPGDARRRRRSPRTRA
ncbi:MAG: hypothetical protein JWM47_160 [Acidimicrobiales bacterium]|nr:hypothetical protein [Acidimicrobiales bacterium]